MIPAERAHLSVAANSHPGMSGKNNEDSYGVSAYRVSDENPQPSIFAVVCDGIGGHRAGEVASEIAVETISKRVAASDASDPLKTMKEAIIEASELIHGQANNQSEQMGMGSTCACGWIIGDQLYTANVGDSRIYLLREGEILQVSVDHTWIQEAIDAGVLTVENAKGHPNAHVIRRYLGSKQIVEPDTRMRLDPNEDSAQSEANQGLKLLPSDYLFLCSDGLTDLVRDDEIGAYLLSKPLEEAVNGLINLANRRGGHDNITIVAIQKPPLSPQGQAAAAKSKPSLLKLALITAIVLAVIAALVVAGLFLYQRLDLTPGASPTQTVDLVFPTQPGVEPTTGSSPFPETPASETPAPLPTKPGQSGEPTPTLTPWPTSPPRETGGPTPAGS